MLSNGRLIGIAVCALVLLLAAAYPVQADFVRGTVWCDVNQDGNFNGSDIVLEGVVLNGTDDLGGTPQETTNEVGQYFMPWPSGASELTIEVDHSTLPPDSVPTDIQRTFTPPNAYWWHIGVYSPWCADGPPCEVDVKTIGYWKHQYRSYVYREEEAQETEADLMAWLAGIGNNPDWLALFDTNGDGSISMQEAADILKPGKGSTDEDKALSQLLALILNLTSGKVCPDALVFGNTQTVAGAIDYIVFTLFPLESFKEARDMAEAINSGDAF